MAHRAKPTATYREAAQELERACMALERAVERVVEYQEYLLDRFDLERPTWTVDDNVTWITDSVCYTVNATGRRDCILILPKLD